MRYLLILIFSFVPFSAFAEDASLEALCKSLPDYVQDEGVEYVAGADDVVPADLNPLDAAVPDVVNIPITVKLAERFQNLNIPSELKLEPDVGMLSVHRDGRVEYNGQDISKQAYASCGENIEEEAEEKAVQETETPDGQGGEDALNSEAETDATPDTQPVEKEKTSLSDE